MPITPPPEAPNRDDIPNFRNKAYGWVSWQETRLVPEMNALEANVNAKEASTVSAAAAAEASKNAAASIANAALWSNVQTYSVGQFAIDPVTFLTYGAKGTFAGGSSPSVNTADWVLVSGIGNVRTDDIPQTLSGSITFEKKIQGSISGNAETVTDGAYTTGDQAIDGIKTFQHSPVIPNATTNAHALAYGQVAVANSALIKVAINAAGAAPIYACRAWVNFSGVGVVAVRGSGNVSSITDNGVGDYIVNFSTMMPDQNYGFTFGTRTETTFGAGGSNASVTVKSGTMPTASQFNIVSGPPTSGTASDANFISVAIFC